MMFLPKLFFAALILIGNQNYAMQGADPQDPQVLHKVLHYLSDSLYCDAEANGLENYDQMMIDYTQQVKTLIEQGASIESRDEDNRTVAMHAAFLGYPQILKELLDVQASPEGIEEELNKGLVSYLANPFRVFIFSKHLDQQPHAICAKLLVERAEKHYKSLIETENRFKNVYFGSNCSII